MRCVYTYPSSEQAFGTGRPGEPASRGSQWPPISVETIDELCSFFSVGLSVQRHCSKCSEHCGRSLRRRVPGTRTRLIFRRIRIQFRSDAPRLTNSRIPTSEKVLLVQRNKMVKRGKAGLVALRTRRSGSGLLPSRRHRETSTLAWEHSSPDGGAQRENINAYIFGTINTNTRYNYLRSVSRRRAWNRERVTR